MNPFIDTTVARPLRGAAASWQKGRQPPARPRRLRPEVEGKAPQGEPDALSPLVGQPVQALLGWRAHGPAWSVAWRRAAYRCVLALGLALACAGPAQAVDVNRANQEQLQSIRGIGPKTAQAIIDERTRGGAFASFEDFSDRVKGIGAKKLQSLQAAGLKLAQQGQPKGQVQLPR